ncbi:MAG TPA: hypothetical protein GXZ74_08495 [Tissierellia bacterium]|nr:hypothetical protein [Tissierellia bacterium]
MIRIPGISTERRNEIILELAEQGISTNVHFKPLPLFSAYRRMGFDIADYPGAYRYYENLISLPLFSLMADEDVDYIVAAIKKIIQ